MGLEREKAKQKAYSAQKLKKFYTGRKGYEVLIKHAAKVENFTLKVMMRDEKFRHCLSIV